MFLANNINFRSNDVFLWRIHNSIEYQQASAGLVHCEAVLFYVKISLSPCILHTAGSLGEVRNCVGNIISIPRSALRTSEVCHLCLTRAGLLAPSLNPRRACDNLQEVVSRSGHQAGKIKHH